MSDNFYRDEYERRRPRTVTALIRVAQAEAAPHWFAKIFSLLLLLLCVGLGLVGLILPIIPGLLFLAFAAMLAGSVFPGVDKYIRQTPWMAKLFASYLDRSQGFGHMSWRGKLRFVVWMSAKVLVDSLVLLWRALARLIDFLSNDKPRWD